LIVIKLELRLLAQKLLGKTHISENFAESQVIKLRVKANSLRYCKIDLYNLVYCTASLVTSQMFYN